MEANMFARTGVPHVVLPLWWDCFDFATRAEYLGIGVWGNRKAGIKFGVEELSRSIIEVVDQRAEKGKLIAQKAKKLGFVMGYYRGRETAAEKIMELVEDPKFCKPIEEPKLDGEL
jgi:UDP:flavonoid glycosyltransferase YjiC (YdhE family)